MCMHDTSMRGERRARVHNHKARTHNVAHHNWTKCLRRTRTTNPGRSQTGVSKTRWARGRGGGPPQSPEEGGGGRAEWTLPPWTHRLLRKIMLTTDFANTYVLDMHGHQKSHISAYCRGGSSAKQTRRLCLLLTKKFSRARATHKDADSETGRQTNEERPSDNVGNRTKTTETSGTLGRPI